MSSLKSSLWQHKATFEGTHLTNSERLFNHIASSWEGSQVFARLIVWGDQLLHTHSTLPLLAPAEVGVSAEERPGKMPAPSSTRCRPARVTANRNQPTTTPTSPSTRRGLNRGSYAAVHPTVGTANCQLAYKSNFRHHTLPLSIWRRSLAENSIWAISADASSM